MKYVITLIIIIIVSISAFFLNIFSVQERVFYRVPGLEDTIKINKYYYFNKKTVIKNILNDYNVNFLPNTQFLKLNLSKIKLKSREEGGFDKFGSFSIDLHDSNLLITTKYGWNFKVNLKNLKGKKDKETIEVDLIKSNFFQNKNKKIFHIMDTTIYEGNLYVYFVKDENNCKTVNISVAKVDLEFLDFKDFFNSKECQNNEIQIGKITSYNKNGSPGILFTVNNVFRDQPENYLSQNNESIFGKIVFINLNSKEKSIFSSGHRAPQGLFVENDLILSTEHGPKGGDEINKIIFGENYGWPIASYGDYYIKTDQTNSKIYSKKPYYNKNHEELGFKEPIYAFVPSIGISEIIKLPNQFSPHFQNNFLIGSLNGKSLYRVKFSENFNKLLFVEKIFIGSRIRDLKYSKETNTILLALEYDGQIALINKIN